MALISCPECSKEISDKAAACPNCGAPQAGSAAPSIKLNSESHAHVTRTGASWEGWGFVLIVGGMLVAMATDPPISTIAGTAIFVGFIVFLVGRFK